MSATTTRRVTITGTHEPAWYASRLASCQCCGTEIDTTKRYCDRCDRGTVICPTCHGFGAHYRMDGGVPEDEHCTRCANTGRIARKGAA